MTYNTGNPIGSTDARDRFDNSENLDLAVNSLSQTFVDRLGVTRDTLEGIYQKSAYYRAGTFEDGYTLTNNRQTLAYGNVEYSWSGAFPKVVAAGATPATSGGISSTAWVDRTDLMLRSDLESGGSTISEIANTLSDLAENTGSSLIGTSDGMTVEQKFQSIDAFITTVDNSIGNYPTAAQFAKKITDSTLPIISCYGDSTMWGATVGNLGVQSANNPPAKLAQALNLVYGLTFTVNNRAVSGTTMRGMLSGTDGSGSTFASKIAPGGIDADANIIYCNHCINDSQLNLNIDQYRADIVEFIRLCRDAGKVPIMVTPNPNPPILLITDVKSKRLEHYVRTMREVALVNGVDLVDQLKYFTSSFEHYLPDELIPDGAHLSDSAYKQAGFNLAIPLVSCQTITYDYDFATLTNVSFNDNFSNNRQIQTRTCRCGQVLTANRPASGNEGFNYPVILGKSKKVISFVGLQWNSAANCIAFDNGEYLGEYYQQKQFGNQSSLDWDSDCKFYGRRMAGLHVFGSLFDMSITGLGSGMTFGGVALPELCTQSTTGSIAAPDPYTKAAGEAGDTIITRAVVGTGGVCFTDKSGSQVLVARLNGGVFTVDLYKNGAVVQTGTAGSGLTQQVYGLAIQIRSTSVSVTLDSITVTITTTTKLPNLKPYTSLMPYNIVPTSGV